MPKASSNTAVPPKKSGRRGLRPTIWLQRSEVSGEEAAPSASDISDGGIPSLPSQSQEFWLPHDVFRTNIENSGPEASDIGMTWEDEVAEGGIEGDQDYPEPDEVENILDENLIDAQLENAPDVTNAPEEDQSTTNPNLKAHYLPYLLAAKAPRYSDYRCINIDCSKELDPKSGAIQLWRCASCFGGRVLCTRCLLHSHQLHPFHDVHGYIHRAAALERISTRWNGAIVKNFGYFARLSLKEAGLQVGLGHDGYFCPKTTMLDSFPMTIVHTNGQHSVSMRDCSCQGKERWQLLLECGIFPASDFQPRTGFTFEVLKHQRTFSLRGKTSLQEYYQAVIDLTNAAEGRATKSFSNAYDQFRAVAQQFRGLSMHIRAGRTDVTAPLANGELCVTCPACPQPGINLPENWDKDPLRQLRYVRFLCGDGNFKLQRLAKRKSARSNPSTQESMLGDGAFWAPQKILDPYLCGTSPAADEPKSRQRNACNTMAGDPGIMPEGAHAVDVTGVFCVSCRHIFICPNGVVDFFKGERFRPVDVAFSAPLNALYLSGLRYYVITYDIACKYGVNFKSRCFNDDPKQALIPTTDGNMYIAFCVNKFHQESHEESCSAKNALNYTRYVGRTCGEGVETIWAKMNSLRYSTREMTPGGRRDVLSEHFNDWNWQKTVNIVDTLRTAYLKSLEAFIGVTDRLDSLKTSLGEEAVAQLEERYQSSGGEQFLEDRQGLNWPTRNELFAKMREMESSANLAYDSGNVSYVDFVCKGLQLEEMQAKLCQRAHDISKLGEQATTQMKSQMAALCDKLEAGLRRHYELLTEAAPQLSQSSHRLSPDAPQADEILLPSRLDPEEVEVLGLTQFLKVEMELRVLHAYGAIDSLKRALGMRSWWTQHTKSQNNSQTKRTKGQASLRACQARVKEAARAYSTCYGWLSKCDPELTARFGLQKLHNSDLMLLSEYLEEQHYRHNGRRLPWIWTLQPLSSTPGEMSENSPSALSAVVEGWQNEFIRLEYVHAWAAFERWTEEVEILECEMAAVVRWFEQQAMKWIRRVSGADDAEYGYQEYTCRQFALYQRLADGAIATFTLVVGGTEAWGRIWEKSERIGELVEAMSLD